MIRRYGLEETKRFYADQVEGMELIRDLGRDEGIDFDLQGEGIFLVAHKPSRFRELEEEAEALTGLFGIETKLYGQEAFREVGHDSTEQFGALLIRAGFGIHPLKFLSGLGRAAARHDAVLHPHSAVTEWRREGGRHRLVTARGSLSAERVVLATNGFLAEGLNPAFDGRLLPAMSNVLTTRPLTEAELAAQSWHTENPVANTRKLLFYYPAPARPAHPLRRARRHAGRSRGGSAHGGLAEAALRARSFRPGARSRSPTFGAG